MFKKIVLLFFVITAALGVRAQTADAVYDQYLDFNLARYKDEDAKALVIGEKILTNVAKLPAKSQVLYYNGLAKLYEDSGQKDKAIAFYNLVTVAEPNYYVPHRALGYIYADAAGDIYKQAQTGKASMADYKATVLKALPHLEIAQACDPSDETLTLIKTLYANVKDTAGLKSLPARLKALSKNCITVLSE